MTSEKWVLRIYEIVGSHLFFPAPRTTYHTTPCSTHMHSHTIASGGGAGMVKYDPRYNLTWHKTQFIVL
jgi:hypothetical protein